MPPPKTRNPVGRRAIRLAYCPGSFRSAGKRDAHYTLVRSTGELCNLLLRYEQDGDISNDDDELDDDVTEAICAWYDAAGPGDLLDLAELFPGVVLVCVLVDSRAQRLATYQRREFILDDIA